MCIGWTLGKIQALEGPKAFILGVLLFALNLHQFQDISKFAFFWTPCTASPLREGSRAHISGQVYRLDPG